MTIHTKTRSYLLEYAGASLVLHAGFLALIFLRLMHYQQQLPSPQKNTEPRVTTPQKEPRVIMKRVPVTPTPMISREQESTHAAPPAASVGPLVAQPVTVASTPEVQPSSSHQIPRASSSVSKAMEHVQEPQQAPVIRDEQRARYVRPVKRDKMRHSWYAHTKQPTVHPVTTEVHHSSLTHEMALSQMMEATPRKKLTEAQAAAERFKQEFQEAGVNDYVSAIHHAIAFSLNRMRIALAPHDVPAHIMMQVTITAQGSITHASVHIPGYSNMSLIEKIKLAVMQAAPFRPFPPSITSPDITLTINAYPDGSYHKAGRYSSRPTPLISTLHDNPRGF